MLIRTELLIAEVQAASIKDVDKAVCAARTAFVQPPWKSFSPTERGILLSRLADLVEQNRELLATVEAWDNGNRLHNVFARVYRSIS